MSEQEETKKKTTKKELNPAASFFLKLGVIAGILLLLHFFVFGMSRISGNSMYPSVRDGDLCIFFQLESYHVGDLVSYTDPDGNRRIGRISVMDGTFDIQDNVPLLNGAEMSEEIVYETPKGSYPLPVTIEDGQYWILNDFRSDTRDSRDFGPISRKNLHGKVMFLFRRRGF